jgi:hypothetical protein
MTVNKLEWLRQIKWLLTKTKNKMAIKPMCHT